MLPGRLTTALSVFAVLSVIAAQPVAAASSPTVLYHSGPGSLGLPAARWWITATGNASIAYPQELECALVDTTNSKTLDLSYWDARPANEGGSQAAYFLTAYYNPSTAGNIAVQCNGSNTNETVTAVALTDGGLGFTNLSMADGTGPSFSGTSWHTVASVSLGQGKWWLVGKTNISNGSTSQTSNVACRIHFSNDNDQTQQSLYYAPQSGDEGEVAAQVGHVMSSAGTAKLQCSDPKGRATNTSYPRLFAYKLGRLTRMPVGGSTSTSGAASAAPSMITKYRNASFHLTTGSDSVVSLNVPAGNWFISAKTELKDNDNTFVTCLLDGPGTSDSQTIESFGAPAGGQTGMYLQDAFTTARAATVVLSCISDSTTPSLTFSRVSALKKS
jgi:hypothetical protein